MSDSATDSSDSELEVEEPEEPSPLPAARPTDPEEAAKYDTIKAIWAPRNRRANVEKIKSALVAFKDVVKAVRDEWKTQSQAMKDAENQNNNEKAAELRQKVVQQRKLINEVITTALDKGHPTIVAKYVLFLSPSSPPPTYLARRFSRVYRILMQNTNIYHVIISIWRASELKKIIKCRKRHKLSAGRTQKCTGPSLLQDFADKFLRLNYVENVSLILAADCTGLMRWIVISTVLAHCLLNNFPPSSSTNQNHLFGNSNVADNSID